MSRRGWLVGAGLLLLAGRAGAQADPAVAAAERRLARIEARLAPLLDSLRAERAAALAARAWHEERVAGFAVELPESLTAVERKEAARALAPYTPFAATLLPGDAPLRIWRTLPDDPGTPTLFAAVPGDTVSATLLPGLSRAEWVAAIAGTALRRRVSRLLSPDLLAWSGGVPPLGATSLTLRDVRRALATSLSSLGAECLAGGAAACRALVEEGDAPLTRWYRTEDLPALARMVVATQRGAPAWRTCAAARSAAGCNAFLRRIPPGDVPRPLPRAVNSDLVAFAIATGGAGALDRLIAARGRTVTEQLEAASGRSFAALVAGWTARVAGASEAPAAPALLGGGVWAVVLLCAATLTFARRRA
jgi:hypothetical protein